MLALSLINRIKFIRVKMSTLDAIKDICNEHIADPQCVYKLCCDRYIVVMKKLAETITNELRIGVVDADHAKFRASVLEVVLIVNVNDTRDRPHQILNRFKKYVLMYIVGENVKPHVFNDNLDEVCTGGIHYFKTIETAFMYDRGVPIGFTGLWMAWYESGQKGIEWRYVNGVKIYRIGWYDNGHKLDESEYINGKISGICTEWYKNGQIKSRGEYVNGELSGHWTKWCEDGQISEEGDSIDGVISKMSVHWQKRLS